MTASLERHFPTVAIVVVSAGLLLSLWNRSSDSEATVVKPSPSPELPSVSALPVVDADFGLKPMTVPEPKQTTTSKSEGPARQMTIEEQAISMPLLWAVDLGEVPPVSTGLPEKSSEPEPYLPGTGHPEQKLKIVVIFSARLDRDTYRRDDRDQMHAELAAFAEAHGYDVALDVDAIRGHALRPIYFASEKVDRTLAFNEFLESR